MDDERKHTDVTEAPRAGASASIVVPEDGVRPSLKATAGGKARPSVANKKRARAIAPDTAGEPEVKDSPSSHRSDVEASFDRAGQIPGKPAPSEGLSAAEPVDASIGEPVEVSDDGKSVPGEQKKRKHGPLFVTGIVLLVLVVLAAALVAVFCCMRWVIPQDEADLQGRWSLLGSSTVVAVADGTINLDSETNYDYTLDSTAKTLDVSFSNLSGSTHYRFSRDRSSVALIEGVDMSWQATLLEDLQWDWADFMAWTRGETLDPLGSEEGIILCRQDVTVATSNTASTDATTSAEVNVAAEGETADAVDAGASAEQTDATQTDGAHVD